MGRCSSSGTLSASTGLADLLLDLGVGPRAAMISEEDERLSCHTMCCASLHICLESEC